MNLYNQLAIAIFLAGLDLLSYIWFLKTQNEINNFWYQKFKPDFFGFPIVETTITKEEMKRIHLMYNYLALATGIFAMFFVLFISAVIELYHSYTKRNLASVTS